jgi:hypothetical protein
MTASESKVIELAKAICGLRSCYNLDAPKVVRELNEMVSEDISAEFIEAIYNEFEKGIKAYMKVSCDDCLIFKVYTFRVKMLKSKSLS